MYIKNYLIKPSVPGKPFIKSKIAIIKSARTMRTSMNFIMGVERITLNL